MVPVWYISAQNDVGIAVQPAFSNPDDEEANARLIAAAPELLDALKGLLGFCDTPISRRRLGENPDRQEMVDIARAAIAKAEGREG